MVELVFSPLSWAVAGLALPAITSLVLIIVFMTTVAGLLEFFIFIKFTLVAGMAIYFFVPELKGEFGLFMVKAELLPVIGLVAVRAFLAVLLIMYIVNPVAANAFQGGFFIFSPGMTRGAGCLLVLEL